MTTVSSARHDWEEGQRRFEAEGLDAARAGALHAQRDAVVEELRRRVGSTFTLADLAAAYADSDRWLVEVIAERVPSRGWAQTASIAAAAAFHAYSRQALDYAP
jgi:hypothetical protein